MLVIGVAGGVASGKSLVTACFQQLGAEILDADRIGHEILLQPNIVQQISERWGADVLIDGQVDRRRLARIVFSPGPKGTTELKRLEKITHPPIGSAIREKLERLRTEQDHLAVVLDAPVMFKAGWDRLCDKIVFVDAPLRLRQQRAASRGWSNDELEKRESRQTSIAEKKAKASDIIDNSKSKAETYSQTLQLWSEWNLSLPQNLNSPSTLFPN